MAYESTMGPYKGKGSIGRKTADADIKKMGSLDKAGVDNVINYDEHKKAVASHDATVCKRNKLPKHRQQ